MSLTIDDRRAMEEAIVSFAFTAPHAFAYASSQLRASDFSDPALGALYGVLCELKEALKDTSDAAAVLMELKQRRVLPGVSLSAFVGDLIGRGHSAANVRYFTTEVQRMAKLTRIQQAAQFLALQAEDLTASPDEVMAIFDQATQEVVGHSATVSTLSEAAAKAMQLQRDAADSGIKPGIPTGFGELDAACGGLFRGQLVLLSGRTYTGKTTFALNLAQNLAEGGAKVAIHCLEMKDYELAERFLCADANIELNQFATSELMPDDFVRADESIRRFQDLPIWLHDSITETVTTIRGKAKYHKAKHGLDVLFVDHLQRLSKRDPRQERYIQLNEDVRALKDVARELDCVVVLLTQLKVNEREDNEPTDADYAEARQIRQEADLAMMLHRKKDDAGAKLILNKVRKGGSGEIQLNFDGPHQKFTGVDFDDLETPTTVTEWNPNMEPAQ
jgi:replicative DNA helicase